MESLKYFRNKPFQNTPSCPYQDEVSGSAGLVGFFQCVSLICKTLKAKPTQQNKKEGDHCPV